MVTPQYRHMPSWHLSVLQAPALKPPGGPCFVEVGPGRGDFLFHLARLHPEVEVIGVEIKLRRFMKLRERRAELPNVTLICGDARQVLPRLSQDQPIDRIFINFPDPWPKQRHVKHRLMQPTFIRTCITSLARRGELWFTTDVEPYAKSVATHLDKEDEIESLFPKPIITDDPEAFPTFFAQKWRNQGRTIYYQRYQRVQK